jgi:hypothetical protein
VGKLVQTRCAALAFQVQLLFVHHVPTKTQTRNRGLVCAHIPNIEHTCV